MRYATRRGPVVKKEDVDSSREVACAAGDGLIQLLRTVVEEVSSVEDDGSCVVDQQRWREVVPTWREADELLLCI